MNPTDANTAPASASPGGVAGFLAGNRPAFGALLALFAVLLAAPAVYSATKVVKGWGGAAVKKDADPDAADAPPPNPPDPNFNNYLVVTLLGLVAATVAGVGSAAVLSAAPAATPAAGASHARKVLLAVGVPVGLVLTAAGLWFFVETYDAFTAWTERGDAKGAWKILTALLVFVAGAALAFAAAQPARAEERQDQSLRRLVYGANLGITTMLLVMLLVAGNVIVGAKLPNKLDTTEVGFFSLNPTTDTFLKALEQPVTLHVFLPEEGAGFTDARRLVEVVKESNPGRITAKYYDPARPADGQKLRSAFPQVDGDRLGIVVSVGEKADRYGFVPIQDMVKIDGRGADTRAAFQGEAVLMKELVFLAENRFKPVVYFTQGSGELALASNPDEPAGPARSMTALKAYLEKNNVECRPLVFSLKGRTRVPADAAVVVVADPALGMGADAAEALTEYMTNARPDGKKGKLLLLAGAHATPPAAGEAGTMQPTGLEEVLNGFNVQLPPGFVYANPDQRRPASAVPTVFTRAAVAAKIPAAASFEGVALSFDACRVVLPGKGNPNMTAAALMTSLPGQDRLTWIEQKKPADPDQTFVEMINAADKDPEIFRRKDAQTRGRPVGAFVTENGVGRVVVYGTGTIFNDETARRFRGDANPAGQLVALTLDWLRERKDVPDVVSKPLEAYTLPANYDGTRMLGLPLVMTVFGVLGLGLGVWAVRRK